MAQVDKKPCYFGAMLIDVTAASRVAYIRGGPEVKKWVGENNPCPSLFTGWGEDTEAVRAAKSRRDLDGDVESGDTDFSQIDIDDHSLPDLRYIPGRILSTRPVRC